MDYHVKRNRYIKYRTIIKWGFYMYRMWREYASKPTDLPTDDLLEAVKMSINCEADFYIYGRMIASWMGLSMEENIRRLDKEGIETYVVDGDYRFKYKDPEKC